MARFPLLVALCGLLLLAGCSQSDDPDLCRGMCQRLAGCGLCLTDVQDNCLTLEGCVTDCRGDPALQGTAACIDGLSGCDKAGFNRCLSGAPPADGGVVPAGSWTFTGEGVYKETQVYKGTTGTSCAVKVTMTATVNVKAPGWVELGFQIPLFNHNVDLTGPAGAPPKVTCTTGSTLEGKTYYSSSYDKATNSFALQESAAKGPWLKGSFDAVRFKASASVSGKVGLYGTITTVIDLDLPRRP